MTYSSALAMLPKFLWKSIFDYLTMIELRKLSSMSSYTLIFTDIYCKELVLGDKMSRIIAIQTDQDRIDNFWKYVIDNYTEHDILDDVYHWIQSKSKNEGTYVTVFIKSGLYMVNDNLYGPSKKQSISINGSKLGQTEFRNIRHEYAARLPCVHFSRYYSAKNIIFNDHVVIESVKRLAISNCKFNNRLHMESIRLLAISNCTFNDYASIESVKHLAISNCKFNWRLYMKSIKLLTVSNSTFDYRITLQSIRQSDITNCVLNQKSTIVINYKNKGIINFNNNIVKGTKTIFLIANISNSSINIHNNVISDLNSCIDFYQDSPKYETNCFLMQNNHITNVLNRYNIVNYLNNIRDISKHIQQNIHTKCKIIIDDSNTLTECGFGIDS